MKSILFAFVATLSLLACISEPTSPAPTADDSTELTLPADVAIEPAPATCTGKVRCACFEVSSTGAESKITGSDFNGVCDPNNECKPACAASNCRRGTPKSTGDSCRISTPFAPDVLSL